MIVLETQQRVTYKLDDAGNVMDRTDGPRGWNYSGGQWTILGFLTRWNSRHMVPLADALNGTPIGHGYVVDLDHGYRRVWMGHPGRATSVRKVI